MLFLPEFVQTEYVARGFRILIAPFGLDIAMGRGRPESRVVFVQVPIRESVRQSLQWRTMPIRKHLLA